MECVVAGFADADSPSFDPSTEYTLTMTVNYISFVSLTTDARILAVKLLQFPLASAAVRISPGSVSPVLRQNITVSLGESFPPDLSSSSPSSNFRVFLVGVTDPDYYRDVYIAETDDVEKTLTFTFNGAPSGDYLVVVDHIGLVGGLVAPEATTLNFDAISPSGGSLLGGTVVTITTSGTELISDNAVKIGDNFCMTMSSTDTEIVCRIMVDDGETQIAESVDAFVFTRGTLRGSADCTISSGTGCVFEYADPVATVSVIGSYVSNASIFIYVTGTGFVADDDANTELYIDGIKLTTIDVTVT